MRIFVSTNGSLLGAILGAMLLVASVGASSAASSGTVLFVDDDCRPGGDGRTWATGFQRLQDALRAARAPASGITEIRIAQGIHKPDEGAGYTVGDITAAFDLVDGVSVLGGFAGVSARDPDVRDILRYETILDGDLLEDDGALGTWVNYEDNSLHILRADGLRTLTRLDGLTIQRSGSDFDQHFGGGLLAVESALQISACTFAGNRAYAGGALRITAGNTTLTGCAFRHNTAINSGGAITAYPFIHIRRCEFSDNWTMFHHGGAVEIFGSLVQGCTFEDNHASSDGGAAMVYDHIPELSSTFVDCVFSSNSADYAGAVAGRATHIRCRFVNNYSSTSGGAVMRGGRFSHCVFDSNRAANAGGGAIEGAATVVNSLFVNNDSDTYEGGGGALNLRYPQTPSLFANCVFNANRTQGSGGAVRVWPGVEARFVNCAFIGNLSVQDTGGAVSGAADLANCICWQNAPAQLAGIGLVSYSCIQGGWPGVGTSKPIPRSSIQWAQTVSPVQQTMTFTSAWRLHASTPQTRCRCRRTSWTWISMETG